MFLRWVNTDCEDTWTQLLWSILSSLPLTPHNPLWFYWMHSICKAPSRNNFWNEKDIFYDSLHVFIPDVFALNIAFRTGLVSSSDTASFSSDCPWCACAVACVYEPSEVFQASLTWHINTSCCTFEVIQCHCQWQRRMAHHSAWHTVLHVHEVGNTWFIADYLSMEISLLTSKMMKLFELWWRCGKKGKYDFVFMLFQLYLIFYFFLLHWNTWFIYLPMIQLVWILFITCSQH